jgi:two-component system phosphate regulon sensor histidine kinase PhoR
LTIIKWYLSMMLDGDTWEFSSFAKRALWQSLESTNWLILLVNDMLDLSKMSSWNMVYNDEYIDILELSSKLYHDLDIIAKQKWIVFNFLQDWDFFNRDVFIDVNRIRQVIINLVNNAFKFTKSWWFVNLKIFDLWYSVKIEVEDNWIWMSSENLEKIFDKFYQIDSYIQRKADWLWLWLAISQGIISNYNSKIYVESEEWVGTKFFFELKKQ